MAISGINFYKNAYMLEFRSNNIVQDCFTFSVAPESEEFDHSQRVNETKTFGGSVVDDYGNDTVRITLSGTTGNTDKRMIFRGKMLPKYKNGEGEVLYIRDLIEKYGKYDNLKGKSVYLYRLNPLALLSPTLSKFWWRVHITNFEFKRSKDKPLFYSYKLSMIGYKDKGGLKINQDLESMAETVLEGLDAITTAIAAVKTALSLYQEGINLISQVNKAVSTLNDLVNSVIDTSNGILTSTAQYFEDTKKLVDRISYAKRVTDIQNRFSGNVEKLQEAAAGLVGMSDKINSGKLVLPTSYITQCNETESEIQDNIRCLTTDIQSQISIIAAIIMRMNDRYSSTVLPGDDNTDDQIIRTYGYKEITVADGMTWDALALKYFGDAGYGAAISSYNAMNGNSTALNVGDRILIPIISETSETVTDNAVYNAPGKKDNMGTDIKITDSGDLAVKSGDLDFTIDTNTLTQAINQRLTTAINSRCRQMAYGIESDIGIPVLNTYILASIEQTLLDDPRISSVDEIAYQGKGDGLVINIVYTDINGVGREYAGTI